MRSGNGSGCRILDPGSRILDPISCMQDPASSIQDADPVVIMAFWVDEYGVYIQDPVSRILDPRWESWIQNPGSKHVHIHPNNVGLVVRRVVPLPHMVAFFLPSQYHPISVMVLCDTMLVWQYFTAKAFW